MKRILTLCLVALLASCQSSETVNDASACLANGIGVDADFASGNLGVCQVRSRGVTLRLEPENEPINPSPWYAFRLSGQGATEVILDYGTHTHRYHPKVSSDGVSWRRLEDARVTVRRGGQIVRLRLDVEGTLWVAGQEIMDGAWYATWYEGLKDRYPNLVLREFGKSRAGAPLHVLETNPDAADAVFFVGRQHPPELTGAIAMVAFVERLLEGHPDACGSEAALCAFYRDTNIVFAPLLNPDGVARGHWRHSLGGLDINRDWGPFSQPETQAVRSLIDDLAARQRLRVFMDFHSTRRNLFYFQDPVEPTLPAGFAKRWLDRADALGVYRYDREPRRSFGSATSKNYVYNRFGIPAITYEVGDETDRDQIRQSARVFAEAMVQALYPFPVQHDLALVNGRVVDGSGRPAYAGTVAITGRHISYVGEETVRARETVDVGGRTISPGFIDPHTHATSDLEAPETSVNAPWLRQGVTTVVIGNDGGGRSFAETEARLADSLGTNVATFVGHGYLRAKHVGRDDVDATEDQLRAMKETLEASLQAGALGLSSGLFYAPGSFAGTDEVIDLARVVSRYGGIYDTHLRDEADYSVGLAAAVGEAIEIAERASVATHIAHIKALGPAVQGQSQAVIEQIVAARDRGVRVTADQYPWLASGTRLSNALLPRWVQEGGRAAMLERFDDPGLRERLLREMTANLKRRGGADRLLITGDSPYRGMTLAQISEQSGLTSLRAALDIVRAGDPAIASFMMTREDVDAFALQDWVVTGSDGSTGHPRKYATFPKKFQDYVGGGRMSVERFVQASSAQTADILNLCDRGRLKVGQVADIAVWDPATFRPLASYEAPTTYATGVDMLWVEGQAVIAAGEITERRPGRLLRRLPCAAPPSLNWHVR